MLFIFFKQKTAYELRISDWSSDVCSSDLLSVGDAGAAYACFTCHGLDGRGDGAGAPRLAGLGLGYLNRQLEDYATGRRRHPEMELIAKRLSPDHRQAVSAHYASLSYAPQGTTTRTPAPRLYVDGDA